LDASLNNRPELITEKLSREQRQCYSYVEIIIQWEGRLTLQHLQQEFGFGRSKAKKLLAEYTQYQPNNLIYDPSLKGHKPSVEFTPAYTQGHIDEYCRNELSDVVGIQLLEAPLRNIDPNLIRPILCAIRNKQRIDIGYHSLSSPDYESRIISPHSLVFDGLRYHVRAHCEKNNGYRDFVLSRFCFESEALKPEFEGPSLNGKDQDEHWNTELTLSIEPDIRLNKQQQKIIALDYQMQQNEQGTWTREISVRAALAKYLLQRLRLDQYQQKPEAQQIVISQHCLKTFEVYLK
jgi:predicted DNA-binding transcriptional regulator YafY